MRGISVGSFGLIHNKYPVCPFYFIPFNKTLTQGKHQTVRQSGEFPFNKSQSFLPLPLDRAMVIGLQRHRLFATTPLIVIAFSRDPGSPVFGPFYSVNVRIFAMVLINSGRRSQLSLRSNPVLDQKFEVRCVIGWLGWKVAQVVICYSGFVEMIFFNRWILFGALRLCETITIKLIVNNFVKLSLTVLNTAPSACYVHTTLTQWSLSALDVTDAITHENV